MARLLIVDDDPAVLDSLCRVLAPEHEVVRGTHGEEALRALAGASFDMVITDLSLPGADGFAILAAARARVPPLPVIVLTGHDEAGPAIRALRLGASDYLVKPATAEAVRAALGAAGVSGETAFGTATGGLRELVGESPAIRELRRLVPLFGRSRATVLLVGETGTGKEVVARALHAAGTRSTAPFVAHNMAATPPDLAESLFFGHTRGAFSGATGDHPGLFEQAQGGTLFLDEIDSFPLMLQPKLLRVLEMGIVRRVGAAAERSVDVRIIAAAAGDLEPLVRRGGFRADLYFRLRELELALPPLRERREDIPLLAAHFLTGIGTDAGARPRLAPAALDALREHDWPGNVRELRNLLRRAVLLAGGADIGPEHLQPAVRHGALPSREAPDLREVERHHMGDVLRSVGGNQSEAARRLGIDRGTLRRRLRRTGERDGRQSG